MFYLLANSLHACVVNKRKDPTSNFNHIVFIVSTERSEKDIFVVSLTADLKF